MPRVQHAPPLPSSATVASSVCPCWTISTVTRRACEYLIAFESASETRNQSVVSTTGGSPRSGTLTTSSFKGDCSESAARAPRQAVLEPDRVQAAGQFAQLVPGDAGLLARGVEPLDRLLRVVGQLAQREVQRLAEHHEPLLRAVVQVAPDPAALLVGGVHGARAAGDQLVAAGAQGALVAAALELGAGAGGEDLQRLQLGRLGIQLARGGDAEVADRPGVGAAQRDRQVALDRVGGRNWSAG